MSLFDSILKQVAGAPDDVANLAGKLGLPAELTEKAIAALGKSHQEPGDTGTGRTESRPGYWPAGQDRPGNRR